MKSYAFITLLSMAIVATILLANDGVDASNYTWGVVGRYDRMLHHEFVQVSSSWLRVVSRDVVYPAKGYLNLFNITAIKAIDRARKNGGFAGLTKGGIGHRNVTVHLKSERSSGLNFTVEIYGH